MASILLVQSVSLARSTSIDFLTSQHHHVRAKISANDAIRLLEEATPDVIVIDDELSGDATGLELLETIKTMPSVSGCFVIVVLNNDDLSRKLEALKLGANLCLVNPINHVELALLIRNNLSSENNKIEG